MSTKRTGQLPLSDKAYTRKVLSILRLGFFGIPVVSLSYVFKSFITSLLSGVAVGLILSLLFYGYLRLPSSGFVDVVMVVFVFVIAFSSIYAFFFSFTGVSRKLLITKITKAHKHS